MYQPDVHRTDGLPDSVTIYEVGARDGLQNESAVVDVEVKAEFVRRLAAAGLKAIETTSFVPATWIPQLADAAELLERLGPPPVGARRPVLVPNLRGLERALDAGAVEIAIFGSATETFAKRNLNRTVDESLTMFAPVVEAARSRGVAVRGYLSMCFGDPWEGAVAPKQVAAVARRIVDLGVDELSLGDTIGVATPAHVEVLLAELAGVGIGPGILAVHFHDTYGQALANTLPALRAGVRTIDASAGGLGGCPYAKSATGNLATEDLVWMLHGLGIDTGVDLAKLSRTSLWMAQRLGRPSPSRVTRALAGQLAEEATQAGGQSTNHETAAGRDGAEPPRTAKGADDA
ncbi:hydroxymethylglutaryl-CoA lyase [Parafrankia elaeagni]|uniref:hydroxymethylglutaryl-CoA lyase n=1 Tax=Parafrankia elaeagni TaxID=222534 RepID=UPI0003685C9D|nr:hydroxymethylglutaryl-CoA lyase [Parafrankia elaeagni]